MALATPLPALALVRAVPAHPYRAPAAQELTVTDVAALSRGLEKIETKLDAVYETMVRLAVDSRGYDLRIAALVEDVREARAAALAIDGRVGALERASAGTSGAGRVAAWLVPILVSIVAIAVAVLRR